MWGNRKRQVIYYSCQPSHQRSKNIPADHPPHVYLNEGRLNDALFGFLAIALFGPDRIGYWQRCLDATAELERAAPAVERIKEVHVEIAELERRLSRQLANLEADDDVTPALRRRISQRVGELEAGLAERNQRLAALAEQAAAEAPTFADVAPILDRLPVLAERLANMPQRQLRALLDRLQLDIAYQPAANAIDVALTLYDDGQDQPDTRQVSEDWSAPPGGAGPVLRQFVRLRSRLLLA